jgi:1,4-alpha-glucan branching enzyme
MVASGAAVTMTLQTESTTPQGYLALILHAHLPFVRHPESTYMMEENWLFEAITETYLPLLSLLQNARDDAIPVRFTLSLTPTLCTMLADDLLKERYRAHLSKLIELAEKEVNRTAKKKPFHRTAQMYLEKLCGCRLLYEARLQGNLLDGFKYFQDIGMIEIITCGATHGYLPTMQCNPQAVYAQLAVALQSYETFFKRSPTGVWLPECGYYPGLETLLEKTGLRYFFTESHGLLFADPPPEYGVYAPVYCREARVAAFARDSESSRAVWSAQDGYPGHPSYRDFYRDIGFDLDIDYIKPYIDPIGIRINTGLKYYRITGPDRQKLPYDREAALRTASEHAGNFMFNRQQQVQYLRSIMDRPPVIVSPYDAELFGHWWYEGPEWLNFLFRKIAFEQNTLTLITPSDYLAAHPENQTSAPSFSSWGEGGYSDVWLHESNNWIYRHLHHMEAVMTETATAFPDATGLIRRTLNQMARELMLAESSDWAFIMKTGTMVTYAVRRTKEHIANFLRLHADLQHDIIDPNFVTLLESHNNIFPSMDYSVYSADPASHSAC